MKKIISAITTASLLLTGLCGISLAEDEAKISCITENAGDANGDGTVNAKDVSAILKYCAGFGGLADTDIADVTRDAAVNAKDAAVVLKYLAGFEVFPGHGDVQISESEEGRTVVCADCGYVFEGESPADTAAEPSTDTTAEPSTDTTAETPTDTTAETPTDTTAETPADTADDPADDPVTPAAVNMFDITDYGAVTDGKTDCTAAIQAALDAAGKVHGTVIVPPGKYLTGELQMYPHTSIEGYGGWSFRDNGVSTLILNDPNAKCLLNITGAVGCTVNGLSLHGGYVGKNVHGIYLKWDRYNGGGQEDSPHIEDSCIRFFSGDGIHLEKVWSFYVTHTMSISNSGSGLYIDGYDAMILDSSFSDNRSCGILGGGNAAAIAVTGCRIEWNRKAGVRLPVGDSAQFTGNTFDRAYGPGLWLGSQEGLYVGVSVSGNLFRRNGKPDGVTFESPYENSQILFEKVTNAAITGNVFSYGQDDGGVGTFSPDFAIVLDICKAVTVQGNAMYNGALKESVIWDGLGDCVFEGNTGLTAVRKQAVSDWDDFE